MPPNDMMQAFSLRREFIAMNPGRHPISANLFQDADLLAVRGRVVILAVALQCFPNFEALS